MILSRFRLMWLPVVAAGSLLVLSLLALSVTAATVVQDKSDLNSTLGRSEDPVILTGAELAGFQGQPIADLVLYAFSSDTWSPIPFQIDERTNDITGTFVVFEDGLLDDNDELVFMAKDAGQAAGQAWPDDEEAQGNPRYEILATDTLTSGDNGWAYLYRSTTLATSPDSYVDWNEALQKVTAISYTASFSPSAFLGLADLTINNNGVDILDRQKTRVDTFILDLNEESLIAFVDPTISISVVGPVRGVAGAGQIGISIYGARLDLKVEFDTSIVPLNIDGLRMSFDLNDPAVTGITNFYDSNGSDYPIDGSPDAVSQTPRFNWYQASGVPGGVVAVIPEADAGDGIITNYYKDDDTFSANDTGDKLSFADTGLSIEDPGSIVSMVLSLYTLPPGSTANVGASYYERVTNPLEVTTEIQSFVTNYTYLPAVLKPS